MKCNPWRWLWGLIPILMLGWIAVVGERTRIETDLAARTLTTLKRSGYAWADVRFDGRDAVLLGKALDESEPPKALGAALDTFGVRIVDNRASLLEKVEKFEWSAIRRSNRIRIDGLVPSDKARRDVLGMAKASFPTLEIDDRTKLARGAPELDIWLGGVGFAVKQLAQLSEGRVDLENTSLTVKGDAIDARSYRRVKTALTGTMPQGVRLKSESVRAPAVSPYVWSAKRQGTNVVLGGHVPNDTVRGDLVRLARRIATNASVVDRMEPASGEPEGFAGAAAQLVEQLGVLDDGSASLSDRNGTLTGTAETAALAGKVQAGVKRGNLAKYSVRDDIRNREPKIKRIDQYVTAARIDQREVVLTGYVPDEGERSAFVAKTQQRFQGWKVRDALELGAGQPQGWSGCIEVGLEAMQKLGNGQFTLAGRRLEVSGKTRAEALAQSLPGDVRTKVGNWCDVDVRVTLDVPQVAPPPSVPVQAAAPAPDRDAELRAAEDAKRLADQEAVRQAAAEVERLRAAEDAARERAAAAAVAADEKRRLEDEANRARAEVEARRRAEEEARQQLEADRRAALARLEDDRRQREEEALRLKAQKAEADRIASEKARMRQEEKQVADACQEALSRVVREGVINFSRANYDLDPSSYATLNRVAEAANRCPSVVVEIEGHTDSEGTVERNDRLSNRRANAVRNYLTKAGVSADRLTAIGYGATRNVAPNDTAEGRARNRRIEFTVKLKP